MDLYSGVFALSFWECTLVTLLLTHVTIAAVTIFLHRGQAHRSVEFEVPTSRFTRAVLWMLFKYDVLTWAPVAHFFRYWLWKTTGMVEKEWVSIHRKHHARCEMEGDPHSPIVWLEGVTGQWRRALYMCWFVFFAGVRMYVRESRVRETMEKHGAGTSNDWIERNVYSRFPKLGILLMLTTNIVLFGVVPGFFIWLVQMFWIPIFAAGVINGIGHFVGYRNFESCHRRTGVVDSSRNIVPWGILIGGEELHNNHHADELSAKLSVKWYEFDIGWLYIRIFHALGLIGSIRQSTR